MTSDLFDEIELDTFDEVELDVEDKVIFSSEMRQLLRDEIRKEIANIPVGKIVSRFIEKEGAKQKESSETIKSLVVKEGGKTEAKIQALKEEFDLAVKKLKQRYADLRNELGSQPAAYQFGGFPLSNPTAWAAGRGAVRITDGTSDTYLVGVQASDTPSDGQVPTFHTDGTITWETGSGGASTATTLSLGDPLTNGSWRIIVIGNDLAVQQRVAGSWVEKGLFPG